MQERQARAEAEQWHSVALGEVGGLRGPRPKAEKWQFVSRTDARQTAIQGALEDRSLSATAAHRSTGSPICIGSVGSRGRRQSWNRSGIEACEGPGPRSHSGKSGTGARGHVRSSTRQSFEVGGSNRGHGRVRVQKFNTSRELWHVPESPPPRLQWTCN